MISAASHHFSLPAIARNITSCTFIVRSIAVRLFPRLLVSPQQLRSAQPLFFIKRTNGSVANSGVARIRHAEGVHAHVVWVLKAFVTLRRTVVGARFARENTLRGVLVNRSRSIQTARTRK
jgi:hypothetical protein